MKWKCLGELQHIYYSLYRLALFMTLTIVEKEELFLPDVILFGAYAFLLIWIGVDIYGVFRRLFRLD